MGGYHVTPDGTLVEGVDLMEKIGGLTHATQLSARHPVHVLRDGGAGAHKDGVEALVEHPVDVDAVFSDQRVVDEVDTQFGNLLNLRSHHVLWQSIFGNAPHQHAAGLGLSLVDGHGEAFARQVAGHGQSCGA